VTAFSIIGLSAGSARPSPSSILVASLVDGIVERSYSLGRIFHLADAETKVATARIWIGLVEQADLLVLGVQLDGASLQRFERHLDLIGMQALVDKPVLLVTVADRPEQATGLEQIVRPLLTARGAHILPHAMRATTADVAGTRLANPELARQVRSVADHVAAGLGAERTFYPADLHGLVRAHC
jgi:FMN reductase